MAGHEACGPTLSRRIWDLDWASHLPWTFDDIVVEAGSFRDDAAPFIAEHYAAIFGSQEPSRFYVEATTAAKRHFGDEMDVLCFRDAKKPVGILLGHPVDWSTYYFRSVALLPEVRDRGLLGRALSRAHDTLRSCGVDRAEGECSPSNAPMMRALAKLGYLVTATVNSERWGAMVRFTKHLHPEAEEVFLRQFCAVQARSA